MDDEEFIKFLHSPSLIEAYREEKKHLLYQVEQNFNSKRDFLEKAKKNAIEIDRKHRVMINVCVAPFTEKGTLRSIDYRFIRASPLAELSIPNVDFLLYKSTERVRIAIFGEAKGSISKNPDKIINEYKDRIITITQYTDYIKTKYLKIPINEMVYFEYVIAVPSIDAPNILRKTIDKGGGIVVWHAPITGLEGISIAFPPKIIPPTIKNSMIHRDHELNKRMKNRVLSNRKMFNFFPQSHPVSKLDSLIFAARIEETGLTVSEDELIENLSKELFYLDDGVIKNEAKSILSLGLRIDFLEKTTIEPNQYRIKAKSYRADKLAQIFEEKWIKNQLEEELDGMKETAIEEIQSKYKTERQKDRELGDFGFEVN